MSIIEKNCINYQNFKRIGIGSFGYIYKAENKNTNNYVAIKEIDKIRYNQLTKKIFNETEIINIIKSDNSITIKEKIDSKDYFYIIMDLCVNDLENYIKSRENELSINEIKEVLSQLNNVFKIMNDKKIIYGELKPSNILISLDRLDKCIIKLSSYSSSKIINLTNSINRSPLTMAPEILKGEKFNLKSDIWSLGIIIYYMINKEYPYNGHN